MIQAIFRASVVPCVLSGLLLACSADDSSPSNNAKQTGGSAGSGGETSSSGGSSNSAGSSNTGGSSGSGQAGQPMTMTDASAQGGSGGGGGNTASDAMAMPEVKSDASGAVTVYDLQNDWSDATNPFGPNNAWTIKFGTVVAKSVMNWNGTRGQAAYATSASGNGHIPMLAKITASGFEADLAKMGDIVGHAQDESGGPGIGPNTVVWTAPADGTIDVDGAFQLGRTSLRREDVYMLTVAGAQKAMGNINYKAPDNMPQLTQKALPIMKGQTAELQIVHAMTCDSCSSSPCDGRSGTCAEFFDFTYKITFTSN